MTAQTEYEVKRGAYWDAQTAFREFAIKEIERLIPSGVETIFLSINDTPRLAFDGFIDADGEERFAEDIVLYGEEMPEGQMDLHETIDQIANDMELSDWDEAASYLHNHGDQFQIGKMR